MNIICIGDPHFKTDNIPDVNLFMERLFELIKEDPPSLIVVLGDLLHTHERIHTTPLNKAYELIDTLRMYAPTYVLVGNHDMVNHCQFLTENHWMNGMKEWKNVVIVDKIVSLELGNELFIFCPYVPTGRFIEALDTGEKDWRKASCIFAHQEFYGCSMNAVTSSEGDKWSDKFPLIVSGHIHDKQRLQQNIYYTGSAMQHSYGERTKKIIAILTFNNKTFSIDEIDLKLPRKKIIHTTVQDLEEDVKDFENTESKDKIKISVSGSYEEFKSLKKTKQYTDLVKKGVKIVFKPPKKPSAAVQAEEVKSERDFKAILSSLVDREKNPYLYCMYEKIVNNNNISEDDVFFL